MRREFLIDGYNLLLKVARRRLKRGRHNLSRARMSLMAWIERCLPEGSHCTIVFDAVKTSAGSPLTMDNKVQVLFSAGYPNADELIAERCRQHPPPERLVVVSDDKTVGLSATRHGAHVMSCADFINLLRHPPSDQADSKETIVPRAAEGPEKPQAVSEEEKRQWLEAFQRVENEAPRSPSAVTGVLLDPILVDFYEAMTRAERDGLDFEEEIPQ